MQKIIPFLWFDHEAEEAVRFYTSIFKDSSIGTITHYATEGPGPAGTVMTVDFQLFGQDFTAINGGPVFKFTPAVSFLVNCETQEEVDLYLQMLTKDGEEEQCGWLKDRFGLSWQIVPTLLGKLMLENDDVKRKNVFDAMLKMHKIEIQPLLDAYNKA